MMTGKEKKKMSAEEIRELLRLKDWTKAQLAVALGLGQPAVERWLIGDRNPSGPASILMRMWLEEERGKAVPA